MGTRIELPNWINRATVERAYGRAMEAQRRHEEGLAECGMRAARARDGRLLKALEGMSEILTAVADEQQGRTRRSESSPFGYRVEPTELGLVRTAYEFADRGDPLPHCRWIYACAAELAGLHL